MSEYIVVPEEHAGLELDELLCLLFPAYHKGFVRRQVRGGRVLVDGEPARPSQKLRPFQVLTVDVDEAEAAPRPLVAPPDELVVLYEDADVLVVDKPAGLAVEPERWQRDAASLSGALLRLARERSAGEALDERFRLVHRIDKDTSGVVLVAKTLEAERRLRRAFDRREVHKVYLALVEGEHPLADGASELVDLPLGPDGKKSGRRAVVSGGKPSQTRIAVEQRFRGYTLLRCEPLTGRTHQIRVHLSAAGFPLAVDPLYGRQDALFLSHLKPDYRRKPGRPERPLIGRLTLHAGEAVFPGLEGPVRVEAPLPKDLALALKQLAKVRRPRE